MDTPTCLTTAICATLEWDPRIVTIGRGKEKKGRCKRHSCEPGPVHPDSFISLSEGMKRLSLPPVQQKREFNIEVQTQVRRYTNNTFIGCFLGGRTQLVFHSILVRFDTYSVIRYHLAVITPLSGQVAWFLVSFIQIPSASEIRILSHSLRSNTLRGWIIGTAHMGRQTSHSYMLPHIAPIWPGIRGASHEVDAVVLKSEGVD